MRRAISRERSSWKSASFYSALSGITGRDRSRIPTVGRTGGTAPMWTRTGREDVSRETLREVNGARGPESATLIRAIGCDCPGPRPLGDSKRRQGQRGAAPLAGGSSMQRFPPTAGVSRSWRSVHPGWGLFACCVLLACSTASPSRERVLRDGHPRGPGSFCALNPEGCPPADATPWRESEQDTESPENKQTCLAACEAGGEVLAAFCRRLRNPRRQALCWGATEGSKRACRGMCYAIYECGDSDDCPTEDEP